MNTFIKFSKYIANTSFYVTLSHLSYFIKYMPIATEPNIYIVV